MPGQDTEPHVRPSAWHKDGLLPGGYCGPYLGKPGVSCLRRSLEYGEAWGGKSRVMDMT